MPRSKYLLNSNGYQMSSSELLASLGLKPNSPIPPNYSAEKVLQGVTIRVEVSQPGGKHRVKAVCPNCKSLVPAGRLHQHAHSNLCEGIKANQQS